MHKKTLNIISVCIVCIIIVFSITQKARGLKTGSGGISTDSEGKIETKADEYKNNILETVSEENVKNFKKFATSFEKSSSDNLTDGLSKDIFTQYIKYNTSGEMNNDAIVDAANQILKNKTDLGNPVRYGDIKTNSSNIANLKIYGNNVALIVDGVNKGLLSLNTKKDSTLYIASIYSTAAALFTEIEVPEILSSNHMEIINGYKKYSEGLKELQYQSVDPAKALIGLTKIKDATDEILAGYEKIQNNIILNKVNYLTSEPGYMWVTTDLNNISIKTE